MSIPHWNPSDDRFLRQPREAFDALRSQCPMARSDDRGWAVLGYDEIVAISRDTETFSSKESWDAIAADEIAIPLKLDPPEHGAFRRILQKLFVPATIRAFEGRVRSRAVEQLAPVIAAGGGEMVENVTDPFPVKSLCDFIGWPAEDWREIKDRSLRQNRARHDRDAEGHRAILREWWAYIRRHLEARRTDPRDDVGTRFLAMLDAGTIDEVQLLSMMRLLLQAGHGTTTASAGILLQYLAEHPTHQARLRADPGLIPVAIEEILRTDNPLVSMPRIAKHDVELNGIAIRAGEEINLVYLAANRDERIFDTPAECRFDRVRGQHLIFGTGIHTCVGAPFAKLELRVLLEEMLARTKDFRLASMPDPVVRETFPRNEPRRLMLKIDPA